MHARRHRRRTAGLLLAAAGGLALTGCGDAAPEPGAQASQTTAATTDPHGGHGGGSTDSPAAAGTAHEHDQLDIPDSGVGTLLGTENGFGHELRDVPATETPTAALRIVADPSGGWTVQVVTERFRYTPEEINTPADAGRGHAELYVDGAPVTRAYGEFVHLDADDGVAGRTLTVLLYADDHTAWATGGRGIAAEVALPAAS